MGMQGYPAIYLSFHSMSIFMRSKKRPQGTFEKYSSVEYLYHVPTQFSFMQPLRFAMSPLFREILSADLLETILSFDGSSHIQRIHKRNKGLRVVDIEQATATTKKCNLNVKPRQKAKGERKLAGDNTSSLSKNAIYRRHGLKPVDYWHPCIYPECAEKFNFTKDLYDHIRSHTGEREAKFEKCPYCNVEMINLTALVRHVRTHTKHKPYICPFPKCGQSYVKKHNLSDHLQSQAHQLSDFIYGHHHFICYPNQSI